MDIFRFIEKKISGHYFCDIVNLYLFIYMKSLGSN